MGNYRKRKRKRKRKMKGGAEEGAEDGLIGQFTEKTGNLIENLDDESYWTAWNNAYDALRTGILKNLGQIISNIKGKNTQIRQLEEQQQKNRETQEGLVTDLQTDKQTLVDANENFKKEKQEDIAAK